MKLFLYEVRRKWWLFFLFVIPVIAFKRNMTYLSSYVYTAESDVSFILALYMGRLLTRGDELELIKGTGTGVKRVFYTRVATGYLYAVLAAVFSAVIFGLCNGITLHDMLICVVSFICSSVTISAMAILIRVLINNAYVSHIFIAVFMYFMMGKRFAFLLRRLPKEYMLVDLFITSTNFAGTLWWLNRLIYFLTGLLLLLVGALLFNKCFARKEHLHAY